MIEFAVGEMWAVEIKRSSAPKVSRGFRSACRDLQPSRRLVVYPGREGFPLSQGIEVVSLQAICDELA